ncbi:uveal autoantigen with coiled-coil/ankyrin [Thalictrum thalictroides]|uniref:Uveal autoantigen with coiled-coil/ankyrin n=1 Tax=Thalictrum thalictroides TaxID=46969 RepID=A0A7J6WTG6_THATH|nr:uveal autoantigen with coiled-coil/ankyrin [Thalictrum thalictroides]
MANSDSNPAPLPPKKDNIAPIGSRLTELSESRVELLTKIQSLKQDLQSWRSKLNTQVKVYQDELSELKKSLNIEVEQLKSEFQELRTNLQQQEQDATSLMNLALQDILTDANGPPGDEEGGDDTEVQISSSDENNKEMPNIEEDSNVEVAQISPPENGNSL